MDKSERQNTVQLAKMLIEKIQQLLINGSAMDESPKNERPYYQLPSMEDHRERYYVGDAYPGIYFTEQEALCLFYFLQGYPQKKVAEKLEVQLTTISSYSRNIRCKMGCSSIKTLVDKIKKTDFMRYRFYLEWLCYMKHLPELSIQKQEDIKS